jgi:hypothetical protein
VVLLKILRGNLKAVEQNAGVARVDFRRGKRIDDLRDGSLDGAAILKDGDFDCIVPYILGLCGFAAEAGVEVAKRGIADSG